MTTFLELLDSPSGTVATAVTADGPVTMAIVEYEGELLLSTQHTNCATTTQGLTQDFMSSDWEDAPAARQIFPELKDLLPVRAYTEDDSEKERLDNLLVDTLKDLPVGTVIDASYEPSEDFLEAMLLTRVSEEHWQPMECGAATVDDYRAYLRGEEVEYPTDLQRELDRIGDAEFTIALAPLSWKYIPEEESA